MKNEAEFVYIALSALNSLSLAIRMSLYLRGQGGYASHGKFISCFQGDRKEGQSVLLLLAVPQVAFVQNNEYTTLAYFEANCPDLHHSRSLPF